MVNLTYINDEQGLALLLRLMEKQKAEGIEFIRSQKWASIHCVGTANKGRDLARLAGLDGDLQYAVGIVHDIGKVFEPDPFHEVVGSHLAFTYGEDWGLVSGGTQQERNDVVKRIALNIVADGPVYEEWTNKLYVGEADRTASGFDGERAISRVEERIKAMKVLLSSDGNSLSLERLLLPVMPEQKIALVADMADVDLNAGTVGGMKARFEDILARYENPFHADYNPVGARSARIVMSRYYQVLEEVADMCELKVVA